MRPLFLRVALWILLSVGGSLAASLWLQAPSHEVFERTITGQLVASGLGAVRDDLVALPVEQREAALERARARIGVPLELVEGPASPRSAEFGPDGLFVVLPVGDRVLRAGPYPPPPHDAVRVVLAGLVMVGISLAASVVVVWPLGRRLQALERASVAIRAGALDARVGDRGGDLLARVGQAFDTMAAALERRFRDREELLQAVSHEFGTPLARMAFQVELLAGRTTDPAALDRIGQIRRELTELDLLTAELVAWVQLEGDAGLGGEVDVDQVIAEVVERAADARVRVVRVGSAGTLPGHPTRIGRAVENVLRNALRYARTEIVITREVVGDAVRITVDDDGKGIPETERERIFEPFARLESSREREGGGSGLGLAIVQRTVERHGGIVTSEVSPLGGARFVIVLPAQRR